LFTAYFSWCLTDLNGVAICPSKSDLIFLHSFFFCLLICLRILFRIFYINFSIHFFLYLICIFRKICFSKIATQSSISFLCGSHTRMEVFRFIFSYPFLYNLTYLFSRLPPPLLRGWRQSDSRGPVVLVVEGVPSAWHDERSHWRLSSSDG